MDSTDLPTIISSVKYTALDKCLDSHSHPCSWYYGATSNAESSSLANLHVLERFRLSGFRSACFNQYSCTICLYLTGEPLGRWFIWFSLFLSCQHFLKFNERIKEEGSAGTEQHVLLSTEMLNICSDFCKTPGSKLMKFWIICVFSVCMPSSYCDVNSKKKKKGYSSLRTQNLTNTLSLLSVKMIL